MCADNPTNGSTPTRTDSPAPDWQTIQLPPAHVLRHLTDSHCHPTDLNPTPADLDNMRLGGLAAMATAHDQPAVAALGAARPWPADAPEAASASSTPGPRVVAAFGYHPWFVHFYSLHDPAPPKAEHYMEVLSPKPALMTQFTALLEHLPDPIPFAPLLAQLRVNVTQAKQEGRAVLVGEIGVDGSARVRVRPTHSTGNGGDWSPANLTPFKCAMRHQVAVARAQLDVAADLSVGVSFHCVAAPGSSLDLLKDARTAHGPRFGRINIAIHSCGGMSPAFLAQAARVLPNAYFAPSIAVTARSPTAAESVRAIPRERVLVESDAYDVREMDRQVWAATVWIAQCRGWKVEGIDGVDGVEDEEGEREGGEMEVEEWELEEEEEHYDARGRLRVLPEDQVWAVRTLERNWARFMGHVI